MSTISFKRTLIASGLMILTLLGAQYFGHFTDVDSLKPLSGFPRQIGQWSGRQRRFDQRIYDVLGVDDSFLGDYNTPDGKQINLYIGFYKSQKEGEIIHSPKNCMPGAGWNIIRTSLVDLNVGQNNPHKIKVIKLLIQNEKEKQVVLYWFQSRGRIISSEYWQKIYLVWDAILKHRTDGSFVRLMAPVSESEAETTTYMERFAQQLLPILDQYLPGT